MGFKKKYVYLKKRYVVLFTIIDFIGSLFCFLFRSVKKTETESPRDPKNILVVELANIGDVLAVTPCLRLLKKKFQGVNVCCLVSPLCRDLLVGNPNVDEIIVFENSWFTDKRKLFPLKDYIRLAGKIRSFKFDLGIDMRGDVRVILLMGIAGVRYKVGYGITGGGFFLNKEVDFDVKSRQDVHQADHNLNLIRNIEGGRKLDDKDYSDKRFDIFYSEEDINKVNKLLEENGVSSDDRLIAVHPGGRLQAKRWPVENFSRLIDLIIEREKVKVVLVGGEEEEGLEDSVLDSCRRKESLVSFVGKTNLNEIAFLISKCRMFIGNDTGVMHIAEAVGTPAVVIWGGHSKPSHWSPLNSNSVVIHRQVDCEPCGLDMCGDLKCLKQISVSEVFNLIEHKLRNAK